MWVVRWDAISFLKGLSMLTPNPWKNGWSCLRRYHKSWITNFGAEFQTFWKVVWDDWVGKGRWVSIWGGQCAVVPLTERFWLAGPQFMSKWVTPLKAVIRMAQLSWEMTPKENNRQRNWQTIVCDWCTSLRSGASHLGCEAALYASYFKVQNFLKVLQYAENYRV